LEEFYPSQPKISATTPEEQAIERLLDHWAIDSGLFTRAAQLIPADLPFSKDPKVAKDRQDFSGGKWANAEKMRPEALVEMRSSFELLETTLLKDGRDWVLKTKSPSLSDIEGKSPDLLHHFSLETITNIINSCVAIPLVINPTRRSPTWIHLSTNLSKSVCLD